MINTMDAALLRRCILHFGNNNYIDFNAADLDGDGVVDSVDYTILTRYILNIIDRFPLKGTPTTDGKYKSRYFLKQVFCKESILL